MCEKTKAVLWYKPITTEPRNLALAKFSVFEKRTKSGLAANVLKKKKNGEENLVGKFEWRK